MRRREASLLEQAAKRFVKSLWVSSMRQEVSRRLTVLADDGRQSWQSSGLTVLAQPNPIIYAK